MQTNRQEDRQTEKRTEYRLQTVVASIPQIWNQNRVQPPSFGAEVLPISDSSLKV